MISPWRMNPSGVISSVNSAMTRRSFLLRGAGVFSAVALESVFPGCGECLFSSEGGAFRREARHWRPLGNSQVQCGLCPHECVLGPGERGVCRVRENIGGRLYTLVYSRLAAVHIDPIEKKPFNHFLPGSAALSVATAGCNLRCRFCQNWQLSQSRPEDISAREVSPEGLSGLAKRNSLPIIAFTYNEPTVQFEYVVDAAREAKRRSLRPVVVSSGYIRPPAGREFAQVLDGIKIDLKAFTERFYRDICGASLRDVLRNLEVVKSSGTWLEIVVLVIPTLNDSPGEIRKMTRWVAQNLGPDVPMHFTRFHPLYLMRNIQPTPVRTLERCREIAVAEGIRYAYVGNLPGHRWEHTYCHSCGRIVIRRSGIFATQNLLRNGRCPHCSTAIPGVWI